MAQVELSHCAAEVRRHDPDRFLTALFAPPARREELFALYAFNLEVARTREMVSEALLGQMRLQWWRETIEGIYAGTPRQHAVATPLAALVARGRLTQRHFTRLIEARARDLEDSQPDTLEALEHYAEGTSSSLVALALEALDARGDAAERAARELGIGWALTGLLRALPFHAQRRRLYLPADLTRAADLAPDELFEHGRARGLDRVVARLAKQAAGHIAAARRERSNLPRTALPALLIARLADGYLAELRSRNYDPFALDAQRGRAAKALRLSLAAWLGRY